MLQRVLGIALVFFPVALAATETPPPAVMTATPNAAATEGPGYCYAAEGCGGSLLGANVTYDTCQMLDGGSWRSYLDDSCHGY